MKGSTVSERALLLAPRGRDAQLAVSMLHEAGLVAQPCASPDELIAQLDLGAAFVIATEESLATTDLSTLGVWLTEQEDWSDLPFVLLTTSGGGLERNPAARRYLDLLGNVTFLERPFHPTTLVSVARAALRSRRRQYEARARLAALRESETRRATALGIARLGTFEWNVESGELALDSRTRHIFEFTPQQGTHIEHLFQRVHADDRARVQSEALAAARERVRQETEYRIVLPDGGSGFVHSRSDVFGGVAGVPLRVVGVMADVTERRAAEEATAAERDRQRLMLQQMPGFVALLSGAEHRFSYVNDAYVALAGQREYAGHTVREVFPELAGQGFYELLDRVYASGVSFAARAMPVRLGPAGEERFIDFLYEPVRDAAGHVDGIFVGGYDVTERIRAEASLRDSEARYRTLFENIDEGFCVIEFLDGPDGPLSDYVHVSANPAYAVHAGIPNVVGQRVREMVPDEAGGWVDLYRGVLESGRSIRFERELVATGRYLELAAFRVEPPSRRQVAVLFQDITARKRAEIALRELNETLERRVAESLAEQRLLADIVEGSDAFVQVVDLDYRWLAINRASANEFERIFGMRPKVGQSMLEVLAHLPDHRQAVQAVWGRALAGEEFTLTADFGHPDRARNSYEMKFNTLRDASGQRIGAYQFVYDVTERLRAQQRLSDAEEALRQSQKMEAVGQLTGGVAHDFNNLLTVIKTSVDLLRRPTLPQDRRERYMDAIADTVRRATKLTGQLLAFARRQALKPEVFDVVARIGSIADMLRTVLGSRIRFETVFELPECLIEADVSQFETALVNMVVNARDAMGGEGVLRIVVAARRRVTDGAPERAAISIIDSGCGIAADKLPHIFEPFFTTKEVGKGTGLGLSQVYGFAKQSAGDVTVESEPGRGTCFTLLLPRSVGPGATGGAAADGDAETSISGEGRRVLVVEDNTEVGTAATQVLEDLGYETTWVSDAEQALALLTQSPGFDAVFSDVVMPGTSGIELGREIRRRHPGLPVLLASGYSDVIVEQGRHGFELLQKPYAAIDLGNALARLMRGRRARDDQGA